jgi:hypothetical protein
MRISHAEKRSSLSEKQYVLGRREKTGTGVLNIGRYYALDGSLGASVYCDALRPHMIFICGKRGYGKSYKFLFVQYGILGFMLKTLKTPSI